MIISNSFVCKIRKTKYVLYPNYVYQLQYL